MASGADESTTGVAYGLTCTDCDFETTVEGSVYDALDVAKAHREKHGTAYAEHFVNFEIDGDIE